VGKSDFFIIISLSFEIFEDKKIVTHYMEGILYGKSNYAIFGFAVARSYLYPLAPVVFGIGEGFEGVFLDPWIPSGDLGIVTEKKSRVKRFGMNPPKL
jgi:hypothetical protein